MQLIADKSQRGRTEIARDRIMRRYVPRTIRQLRRLLENMPIGMLTTQTLSGEPHTRPMLVHDIDDEGWLWFVTDRDSRKACELSENPHASIAFQSAKGDRYVSVQGTAVVVRDNLKMKRLWNPSLGAWFPRGTQDAQIVLVAMRVARAEYWLVPRTRLVHLRAMVKAMLTRKRQEAGTHGVLDVHPMPA
jgi:general stress protein 26